MGNAIWTWYRPFGEDNVASDDTGWHIENFLTVNAPESIQRVIFQAGASGSNLQDGAVTTLPYGNGILRAQVLLQDQGDEESQWEAIVPGQLSHFYGQKIEAAEGFAFASIGLQTERGDFALRRAAPPPPADPLQLTWILDFQWDLGTNDGFHETGFVWTVRWFVAVLTSQPGP